MAARSAHGARGLGRDVGRVALLLAALALVLADLPVAAEDGGEPITLYGFLGEEGRIGDADLRPGGVEPTSGQRAIAAELGATVRWNPLGNPQVLINHGGYLTTGLDPDPARSADTARAWLRDHAALFRLTPAAIDDLELLGDSPLYDSPDQGWELDPARDRPHNPDVAHVVRFRQHFDGIPAAPGLGEAEAHVVVAVRHVHPVSAH